MSPFKELVPMNKARQKIYFGSGCTVIGVLQFGVNNVRRKKSLKNPSHTWDGHREESGGTPGGIWSEPR